MQWKVSLGRVGAANVPTWEAFTTNTSEYSFAVNDYIDLAANEPPHSWNEGTGIRLHLHVTPKTANATGADRFAKFTIYVSYADVGEVWAETSFDAELTIPTGTAAMHHFLLSVGTLDVPDNKIGAQIKPRIKRIAATGGTEYADNAFVTQLGGHLQLNSFGSRSVAEK